MKTRKWYSYKDAAKTLDMTLTEFRGLMKNKDLEFRDCVVKVDNKYMISDKGLEALRLNKKPKFIIKTLNKVKVC